MRKRQKFVLTAVVVAGGVLGVQSLNLGWRYLAVGLLAVLSWVLSAWSLREELSGWEADGAGAAGSFYCGSGFVLYLTAAVLVGQITRGVSDRHWGVCGASDCKYFFGGGN